VIGKLNHVAIAVPDLAAATALYRDTLGGARLRAAAPARARRDHRVRRAAEHQDRAAAPPRRRAPRSRKFLADEPEPAASTTSATRSPTSAPRATGCAPPAPACSATASRRTGAHGKPVLFLHPKDFCGTLLELEQAG
jgi:methylmalonyl-CoA/ethylmalonyl-CoA epimerase